MMNHSYSSVNPDSSVASSFSKRDDLSNGHQVYAFRWAILTMFCCLEIGNALMWVTYSPISDVAGNYFGGGFYGSTTSINMMANIFLIMYGPGTILATLSMKHYKLKKTLIIAGIMTIFGTFLRYIAAIYTTQLGYANTYIIMMIGQALAALCQPMFLNLPPAIASIWFPVDERALSTTIGAICSPVGNAIGQILPVILVHQSLKEGTTDEYRVTGMKELMLVEFLATIVPLVVAVVLFEDAPPTPPSQSTQLKIETSNKKDISATASGTDSKSFAEIWRTLSLECRQLAQNKDYVILFIAFSIAMGFFEALLTLLNQMVEPFGYSNDNAGTFGAVFVVAGVVGAAVLGMLMEKTKAFRSILKTEILLSQVTITLMIAMLYSNNFWPLVCTFGAMGFFVLPLMPVMMENCAECTYPVPEELSIGILLVGANVLGLGFIFPLQYLLETPALGPPPLLASNIFIFLIMLLALAILQFYNGEYKRLKHETESHHQLLIGGNGNEHGANYEAIHLVSDRRHSDVSESDEINLGYKVKVITPLHQA